MSVLIDRKWKVAGISAVFIFILVFGMVWRGTPLAPFLGLPAGPEVTGEVPITSEMMAYGLSSAGTFLRNSYDRYTVFSGAVHPVFSGETYHTVAWSNGSGLFATRIAVTGGAQSQATISGAYNLTSGTYHVKDNSTNNTPKDQTLIGDPASNTVWCFFRNGTNIYMDKSTDGGATWATDTLIGVADTIRGSALGLCGAYDGRLWVQVLNETSTQIFYSDDDFVTTSVANVTQSDVADVVGENHPLDIIWISPTVLVSMIVFDEAPADNKVGFYRSADGGATWTSEGNSTATTNGDYGVITSPFCNTTARSNRIYGIVKDVADFDDYILYNSTNSGNTWSETQRDDDGMGVQFCNPALVADYHAPAWDYDWSGFWLFAENHTASSEAINIEQSQATLASLHWVDPLGWAYTGTNVLVGTDVDHVAGNATYGLNHMVGPQNTNVDGKAVIAWVNGTQGTHPYKIGYEEFTDGVGSDDPVHSSYQVDSTTQAVTGPYATEYCLFKDYGYLFSHDLADTQGYADIDIMQMSCYSQDRATLYWRVQYNESSNVFSESSDTGNYITLDTTGSTATRSSTTATITYKIHINWNHPNVLNIDLKAYAIDDFGCSTGALSDTDWQETADGTNEVNIIARPDPGGPGDPTTTFFGGLPIQVVLIIGVVVAVVIIIMLAAILGGSRAAVRARISRSGSGRTGKKR